MDKHSDYAVLISLMTREEAEVVAAALRADGIDAFIGNTNHAYFDWGCIIALGGLQVMAPREQLAEAKQTLQERIRENADAYPDDRVKRKDRWKVWSVIAGSLGLGLFGTGVAASHKIDEVRTSMLAQISMREMWGEMMRRDCAEYPGAVYQLQSGSGLQLVDCRGVVLGD